VALCGQVGVWTMRRDSIKDESSVCFPCATSVPTPENAGCAILNNIFQYHLRYNW